ncbi:S8 family serine peptidase [Pseudomonadota bacterium]
MSPREQRLHSILLSMVLLILPRESWIWQAMVRTCIVDDVFYFAEPMFQDGEIAQAADYVHSIGVPYFSSAGNAARRAYESTFTNSGLSPPLSPSSLWQWHDFDPGGGVDIAQEITVGVGSSTIFSFQWDQPFFSVSGFPGASNDVDIYIASNSNPMYFLSCGFDCNLGFDPVEVIGFFNDGTIDLDGTPGPDTTFNILIGVFFGPDPGKMKYVRFDRGIVSVNEYDTQSATIFGHANAKGARAVGAAFYGDTPQFGQTPPLLESFSSGGPAPILFDTNGNPVTEVRMKPEIVAPDGTDNTFIGFDGEPNGFPNFFGTSASSPHVAALMLSLNSLLTPEEIYDGLKSTAIDMDSAGHDDNTGYGLIQAPGALTAADSTKTTLDPLINYTTKVTRSTDKFYKFGPVTMSDKLDSNIDYEVLINGRLALPASVNDKTLNDPSVHFQDYSVKRVRGEPKFIKRKNLVVANDCSSTIIELANPEGIMVPTNIDMSSPPGLPGASSDHYLCYRAKIPAKDLLNNKLAKFAKGAQLKIADEFQTKRYDLLTIKRWCTPVATSGSPNFLAGPDRGMPYTPFASSTIGTPDTDYLCYSSKTACQTALITGQFSMLFDNRK